MSSRFIILSFRPLPHSFKTSWVQNLFISLCNTWKIFPIFEALKGDTKYFVRVNKNLWKKLWKLKCCLTKQIVTPKLPIFDLPYCTNQSLGHGLAVGIFEQQTPLLLHNQVRMKLFDQQSMHQIRWPKQPWNNHGILK